MAPSQVADVPGAPEAQISSTTMTTIPAERRELRLVRDEDVDALSTMYSDTET